MHTSSRSSGTTTASGITERQEKFRRCPQAYRRCRCTSVKLVPVGSSRAAYFRTNNGNDNDNESDNDDDNDNNSDNDNDNESDNENNNQHDNENNYQTDQRAQSLEPVAILAQAVSSTVISDMPGVSVAPCLRPLHGTLWRTRAVGPYR